MSDLPEAYKIGWVPFIHAKIYLDSRPLIPRTETEYWIDLVVKEIRKVKNPKILDLCAGSGCIGVAVAKDTGAEVDFVELDEAHHGTIRKNIEENGITARTRIFGGDLFENIIDTYDFILANPPYVNMSLGRVEESVLKHEPALALDGGSGGLEIINRILSEAVFHLKPEGVLYLEHEPEQVSLLAQNGLCKKQTFRDQFGRKRFSVFTLSK